MRKARLLYILPFSFAACVGDSNVTPNDGGSDASTQQDASIDTGSDGVADAGPWTPAALDGDGSLALWLEASAANIVISSGNVGVWKDSSKNHNDASNAATGPTIHGSAINGHDSVTFDTYGVGLTITDSASLRFSNDQLVMLAVMKTLTPSIYVFSKARTKNPGTGTLFYTGLQLGSLDQTSGDGGTELTTELKMLDDTLDSGTTNGVTEAWNGSVYDDAKFHIVGMRRTSMTEVELIVDDATPQVASTTGVDVSAVGSDVIVGSRVYGNKGQTVHGEIAEIIVVHAAVIADAVLAQVHGYLKTKYAL